MKKYKLNPKTAGLPIGWIIGMLIVLPFIHVTMGWFIYQSIGVSICMIIAVSTLKRTGSTLNRVEDKTDKIDKTYNGFYDEKRKEIE